MEVTFSVAKDALNTRDHGISLSRAKDFDLDNALIVPDTREHYGEVRYRALGLLSGNPYMLVFTERNGFIRAISLRKLNKAERKLYAQGG